MNPSDATGSTVPAWIADRIRQAERAWPQWVLAAALAVSTAGKLVLLGVLWTTDAAVYYGLP